MLTGPEAGITRDTIAVELEWKGKQFRLHDTAGLRRPPRVQEKLEKLSVADAINAIRFAEVVVVLMDSEHPFEEQDLRIADLVEREGRALVIGISKWDLKEGNAGGISRMQEEADERLPQVKGLPVVGVSGLTGAGLDRLMEAIVDIHEVWNRAISTSQLNKWLEEATSAHPPPAVSGRRIRLNYLTQPKARPPELRDVLRARGGGAAGLQALPRQPVARDLRSARHADPADHAEQGQSLRRPPQVEELTA